MKLYTVNETIYRPDTGLHTENLITTLSLKEAMREFNNRRLESEEQDPIWDMAEKTINDPNGHFYYEAKGIYHDIKLECVSVDITTTYDELLKAKVTSRQTQSDKFESPFEKRLNKQVNSVWSRRQVYGSKTEATADMIYNSGEFIIVFQCDDPSRTVATSLPFDASSYNNITTAIKNIIKENY